MIPWTALTEWGGRVAVITGLATPIYGGLAYLQLTPVTESYVTAQIGSVKKDIAVARVDTLDTKRVVFGLARNDLQREKQALEDALKREPEGMAKHTFLRRLENIRQEMETITKRIERLDTKIEGMKTDE